MGNPTGADIHYLDIIVPVLRKIDKTTVGAHCDKPPLFKEEIPVYLR
jgi:hypothetical protein